MLLIFSLNAVGSELRVFDMSVLLLFLLKGHVFVIVIFRPIDLVEIPLMNGIYFLCYTFPKKV